jgi:membrane associated rhomboid family serine protease
MIVTLEEVSRPRTEREWETPGRLPGRLPDCDYGFVTGGQAVGCTPEELIARVAERGVPQIKLVWTPENAAPVFPEKVPWLVAAFRLRAVRAARKEVYWGAGFLAFGTLLALIFRDWALLYRNFFSVLGAVALAGGVWELKRGKSYSPEDAEADAAGARFAAWLKAQRVGAYTKYLAACIIAVGAAQVFAGEGQSIKAAGLVKPAVWDGQVWRLLTCTLMHANFYHFWMNFLALIQLSRLVESMTRRTYVPAVFLLSAFCGSVFSLLLYPHTTSVGASGGLMGLMGFMTVDAHFDRGKYPPKYLKRLAEAIGFVALLGLFGFAFIDNAAHLGGLCGGALLGLLFLRPAGDDRRRKAESLLTPLAVASLVLLALIAVVGVWQILK